MHSKITLGDSKNLIPDPVFIRKPQNASWHSDNIITNPQCLKDEITLFNLAIPPTINQEFIKRLTNMKNIQQQEQVGDDKTKLAKKTGELYYKGDISTPAKAINVASNFSGLLTMIYANVETNLSLIWTMIQDLVNAMRDTQS